MWQPLEKAGRTWLPAAMQMLAFWPVWQWYGQRMADPSDEPWGLVALATVLVLLWLRGPRECITARPSLVVMGGLVCAYGLAFPFVPPLARALLAVAALGYTLGTGRHGGLALWGLLLLSLPLLPTLQFYLGYPLRLLTAGLAVPLLQLGGFAVLREGTGLAWNGSLVDVDAPCSGVRMLWTGLYLTFTLAALRGLPAARTALLAALAVGILLLGNVFRAAALFFTEGGVLPLPPWTHAGIGGVVFALTALGIAGLSLRIGMPGCDPFGSDVASDVVSPGRPLLPGASRPMDAPA